MAIEIAAVRAAGAAGVPVRDVVAGVDRPRATRRGLHDPDACRRRDDRPQDPSRRRVRRRHAGSCRRSWRRPWPRSTRSTRRAVPGVVEHRSGRALPRGARRPRSAASDVRAGFRWLDAQPAADRATCRRARRLPPRQPDRRRRRSARGARLGARPPRRSDGGSRLAVRQGVAFRLAARRSPGSASTTSCSMPTRLRAGGGRSPTSCAGGRCSAP